MTLIKFSSLGRERMCGCFSIVAAYAAFTLAHLRHTAKPLTVDAAIAVAYELCTVPPAWITLLGFSLFDACFFPDNMPPAKNMRRKQPKRGAKTKAIHQLNDLLTSPKSLLDVTPKTPHYSRITERNTQESILLRLPPELRNRIWTYVLSTEDDITPDTDGKDFKWNLEEIDLDVIGVCRQTYAETAMLPFTLGCFRFRNINRMLQLLGTTSPEQRSTISRIKLPCCCRAQRLGPICYDYPLKEFPGLTSVGVWCVDDRCNEINSTGNIVSRLRNMAGKAELEVHFLDWRAPGS